MIGKRIPMKLQRRIHIDKAKNVTNNLGRLGRQSMGYFGGSGKTGLRGSRYPMTHQILTRRH